MRARLCQTGVRGSHKTVASVFTADNSVRKVLMSTRINATLRRQLNRIRGLVVNNHHSPGFPPLSFRLLERILAISTFPPGIAKGGVTPS